MFWNKKREHGDVGNVYVIIPKCFGYKNHKNCWYKSVDIEVFAKSHDDCDCKGKYEIVSGYSLGAYVNYEGGGISREVVYIESMGDYYAVKKVFYISCNWVFSCEEEAEKYLTKLKKLNKICKRVSDGIASNEEEEIIESYRIYQNLETLFNYLKL